MTDDKPTEPVLLAATLTPADVAIVRELIREKMMRVGYVRDNPRTNMVIVTNARKQVEVLQDLLARLSA